MENKQFQMAGSTTRSAQNIRPKRPSGVASRPTTPQPTGTQATKITDATDDINNLLESTTTVKEYLLKHTLIIHDAPITLEALCYAILHMSQVTKVPSVIQKVLCAIATLMKQIEIDTEHKQYSEAIIAEVKDGIQPILNQLSNAATSLEADTQTLHSQLDDLDSNALKKIVNTIENTAARVETTTASIANTTSSYRDALLRSAKSAPASSPLLDPQVTQHVLLQSRQVLIDTGNDTTNLDSIDSIKSRAEAAIQHILKSPHTPRPNHTIVIEEIAKICNSALLFQFNSKEIADWIRSDDI
jgi:hypothetical protein